MNTKFLVQKKRFLMGSPFSIQAYVANNDQRTQAFNLMELAFAEVKRIEDLMTDFRSSPFNRINEQAGIRPVKVCDEIFDLIDLSIRISKDSDGAFDISYAAVGHLWRDATKAKSLPTPQQIAAAKKLVDYKQIQLDAKKREVFLPQKGMRIGLGGVGKGYAVDRAYLVMRQNDLENVMVNGAGDVRLGSALDAKRPWRIGIRNPFAPREEAMGHLSLRQGAVATSGDYERCFHRNNSKYHHVFDARQGEFTSEVASVTVIASSTLIADVYATTAMALGMNHGIAFLNRARQVWGMMVSQQGDVFKTQALKQAQKEGVCV